MCISLWIPKATNTHPQYVILIAFPQQQWLHEHVPRLHDTCIFLSCFIRRNVCQVTLMCLSMPTCVCVCVCLCRPAIVTERLGSSSQQINNYDLHRAHVSASRYITWSHFLPVSSPHLPHKDASPVDDHVTTQDSSEPNAAVIPPISNLVTISSCILPHGEFITADWTSKQF